MAHAANIDLAGTGSVVGVGGVHVRYLAVFTPLETFLIQHGLEFQEEIELVKVDTGEQIAHQRATLGRDQVRENTRTEGIHREAQFDADGRTSYRARITLEPVGEPRGNVAVSRDHASGAQ